jgi:galactokinase
MTGGGFGGCTINIVERNYSENFIIEMSKKYQSYFNKKAWVKEVYPVEGLINGVYRNEND